MENNIRKHQLLRRLAEKFFTLDDYLPEVDGGLITVSIKEIRAILDCSIETQKLILNNLQSAKEIVPYYGNSDKTIGFFITDTLGLDAFNNKKYLKRNQDILLKWIRNFVQLFIPLASLTIAIMVFYWNIQKDQFKSSFKLKKLEKRIINIEKKQRNSR